MRIFVVGPQHSCTRLFVGLLDMHHDVTYVAHFSVPSGGNFYSIIDDCRGFDHICIITRDPSAINLSNFTDYGVPLDDDIAAKSNDSIRKDLEQLYSEHPDNWRKIHFLSFETLLSFKQLYIRQVFNEMGLNPDGYPDHIPYRPKSEDGTQRWFTVNLEIKDTNKKYFAFDKFKEAAVSGFSGFVGFSGYSGSMDCSGISGFSGLMCKESCAPVPEAGIIAPEEDKKEN